MTWEVLTFIGTIAFAISGTIIAMEEEYDILGVYILGIVTAFGGGAIRNFLIGVPVSAFWDQSLYFTVPWSQSPSFFFSLPIYQGIGTDGETSVMPLGSLRLLSKVPCMQ